MSSAASIPKSVFDEFEYNFWNTGIQTCNTKMSNYNEAKQLLDESETEYNNEFEKFESWVKDLQPTFTELNSKIEALTDNEQDTEERQKLIDQKNAHRKIEAKAKANLAELENKIEIHSKLAKKFSETLSTPEKTPKADTDSEK